MIEDDLLAYATEDERAAYEQYLRYEQALLSPVDFAAYINPNFKRFPHTELLNRYVVAASNHALYSWGIGRPAVWESDPEDPEEGVWVHPETGEEAVSILVISMPPQHGKSFAVTETAPAWYLANHPEHRVIVTGYEADFAKTFARKNREKIEEARIPGVEVDPEVSAANNWQLRGHAGGLQSAGAAGPITGKGAHFMLIDDPVKNSEDALSETKRKKNWDWWLSTVQSRMRKDGFTIIIQTRWHEDDLAGMVIRNERSYVLNIPALAFEGDTDVDGVALDPETGERDPLGRRPGEALCPALHTRRSLEERRDRADTDTENEGLGGALWFSCLYQGKPRILGAGILPGPFPRFTAQHADGDLTFRYTTREGIERIVKAEDMTKFATADLAASTKTRADWTVFSLWGWTQHGDLLLLDYHRSRMESPDHKDKALELWRRWGATYGHLRFLGIEDKTFGTSLIQTLVRERAIRIRPLKADTDKVTRALSDAGPMLTEHRVYFPDTPAGTEFIKECTAFDTGAHDDMVDTFSYAATVARHLPRKRARPQKPEPATADERARAHIERHLKARENPQRTHGDLGRW